MIQSTSLHETRVHKGQLYAWLMYLIAWCGVASHFAFLALFAWFGWQTLVLINVGSLLLYLGIAAGLRLSRHHRVMATLAVAEIAGHAIVATMLLGWASGFHLYLLCLAPILFLGTSATVQAKTACVLALAIGYVLLRHASHDNAAAYEAPAAALRWMEYMNIVGAMTMLSLGAHLHLGAVLRVERSLLRMAHTDTLTGLPNRRRWLDAAQRSHERLRNARQPFSVLMCDLDHFKAINDRHGHAGGDEALRRLAAVLTEALRVNDTVGRWGGEEFAVLLPGTRLADATRLADLLRKRVQALDIVFDGRPVRLSVTIGVAEAQHDETLQHMLQRADAALYRGKSEGRNRVALATEALLHAV